MIELKKLEEKVYKKAIKVNYFKKYKNLIIIGIIVLLVMTVFIVKKVNGHSEDTCLDPTHHHNIQDEKGGNDKWIY